MGRPTRLKGPNLTFHITSRCNGKKLFMKKKSDHRSLCRCLLEVLNKYGTTCFGFTPMGNHFHLIIRINDNDADLSKFMCLFKTAYAKYFNTKYSTSGHFWGDRFKSTIIEDDKYFLACLRYIDRNPVKAGLVNNPSEWMLSSYNCYAFGKEHPILPIELHPTYLDLENNPVVRQKIYQDFVDQPHTESDSYHGELHRERFLATEEFIEAFKLTAV